MNDEIYALEQKIIEKYGKDEAPVHLEIARESAAVVSLHNFKIEHTEDERYMRWNSCYSRALKFLIDGEV